jgi:5-methylcytosine-specific restriction protein B
VFTHFLIAEGTEPETALVVTKRLQALNQSIAEEQNPGSGFTIGHSYFCGNGGPLTRQRYQDAIRHEILPLLKEYWFDDQDRVKEWTDNLLADF